MANYSLVINSQFKPFTYQELLQPALMATEAHHQIEDQYADLASKASVWEGLANEQSDPRTYKRYKSYADELKEAADSLADYGLTPTSRQTMANMRARYSSQILPIQNAYQTRLEQAKEQRQAMMQNPTAMFSRGAATTSLDDYMDNPMLDYEIRTGSMLTQQVAQMAKKLQGELLYSTKPLDKFTNLFLQRHGLSPQQVKDAIDNPNATGSAKILNAMVNDVIESSGIRGWNDQKTLEQAYKYAWQGAWEAVGQTTASTYANKQAELDAELAQKKELLRYPKKLADGDNPDTNPEYDSRSALTDKEYDEANSAWSKYKNYFYKTAKGNWALTAQGREAAKPVTHGSVRGGGISYSEYTTDTQFGRWLKSNGLTGLANGNVGPWQTDRLNTIINKANHATDARLATEYTRSIDEDNYSNVISKLNSVADNDGKVSTYSVSNENGTYTLKSGDKVKVKDMKPEDIKSAIVVVGRHGNYVEVKTDDGTIRVPLSQLSAKTNNQIGYWNQNLNNGQGHMTGNLGDFDDADLIDKPKYMNYATRNALSIFGTSKVKDSEVTQGEYY